jgi:hypothetical protein
MKKLILIPILLLFIMTNSCKEEEGDDKPDVVQQTQTVQLQLDAHTDGGSSSFVETKIAGEEIAVTLGPVDSTFQVTHVKFFFGGTGLTIVNRDVILKVYKENGSANPGDLLYSGNYTIASSDELMTELDLRDEGINVSGGGSIRVSFELKDTMGFPSFMEEYSGTYFNTKNWIKEANGTWKSNDGFGLDGNWVIRATVQEDI